MELINKIKLRINSEDKKRLLSNFFSLSILQGANYILPLITLPYLVRVLGPEKFGLVMFAQAFIQYFVILTDYGFNLSATREISIHRDNKEKVSEIFSAVMTIKLGFLFLSLIIISIIIFSFEKFRQDWFIYYLTFGIVIGQVLFPIWFFQGMEKMKYITFLNITAKLIFTISIFIFIHQVSDYIYVPLINSLGFIVAGILSIWIIFKNFNIIIKKISIQQIIYQLKEGWHIFISTVAISLYTVTNTFILGLFTNNTVVGYYSAAEKLVKAVQGLLTPVSQTIYPYVSKLINESVEKGISFLRKITLLIGGVSFLLSLILFIFATPIVLILLGDKYTESIIILKILSFLPFIVAFSNIFSIQFLLNINKSSLVSIIAIRGAIINFVLGLTLIYYFSYIGAAINILIVEIIITLQSLYFAWISFKEICYDH